MDSITKTFSCTNQQRARAAGDWLIAFLETRGNEIYPEVRETLVPLGLDVSLLAVVLRLVWTEETQPERGAEGTAQAKDTLKCSLSPLSLQVPEFMKILWEARHTVQQSPLKDLFFKALCLLAGFRSQAVVDTLLQTESPSERYVRSPLPLRGHQTATPRLACSGGIQGSSRSHSSPRSLSSARSGAHVSGEAGIVCPAAGEESVWPLGREGTRGPRGQGSQVNVCLLAETWCSSGGAWAAATSGLRCCIT